MYCLVLRLHAKLPGSFSQRLLKKYKVLQPFYGKGCTKSREVATPDQPFPQSSMSVHLNYSLPLIFFFYF